MDSALTGLILISFADNMIHILVQLHNTLKPLDGGIFHRVYFIYSFGFLLIRTTLVVLFADKIYCESSESGKILSRISARAYNTEIDRLSMQIQIEPSCLTGNGFFKLKKSLILSIAGAIVTYELVLLQFYVH
ncbi:PREDICTED: gustatory receptor 5a for trehalose-like [Nicrophorus vespilloides]|uniref:Gustatory receptor 5a for trehalose-like n=1 Tax=Nicrophorus vespilloides TaxID=110193 RepID=A0ABM1NBT6_NICVS|nr:PREDICTED: gustatory receptor 5a for trehalose-like [Nicrophorus vespilloides]